jgi:hypothetical protein
MYAYNLKTAAQVIAGFHASWANIDPLWGDVPFARPVNAGVWSVLRKGLSLGTSLAQSRMHAIRAFAAVTEWRPSSNTKRRVPRPQAYSRPLVARPKIR